MEIVVADIGGTHARFSIAELAGGAVRALGDPVRLRTDAFDGLAGAWRAFADRAGRALPRAAGIALAAPLAGDSIKLTNSDWVLRPRDLAEVLGLESLTLVNDFAAVAHAVGAMGESDLAHLCGPDGALPNPGTISIVGPGTGLGVAALHRAGGHDHVLATEGGHVGFAPSDEFEDRLLAHLRARHGRVSVERVASGPGLRAICAGLAADAGRAMPDGDDDDAALWRSAIAADSDPLARAGLERFCRCLGAAAGDIALAHGAGAVVIAGGLGLRLKDHLPRSGFAAGFCDKGRYEALMRGVPVRIATHREPGLLGAAIAFAREHHA